jgi:hypothetical protein
MTDSNNDWIKLLELARKNASDDLAASNNILNIVEDLMQVSSELGSDSDRLKIISKDLIELAVKLTEQSKKMSYTVSKIVGVI